MMVGIRDRKRFQSRISGPSKLSTSLVEFPSERSSVDGLTFIFSGLAEKKADKVI